MTCEACGNDPVADARARDIQHEIKRQYRRALYLACGGDKEKVKRMMSRAEDEMCQVPPNTVLRPSSNELGEAIDAAVEMIERLEAAEKSDAESIAMYRKARDERDALRAKIEATEEDRARFLVEMGRLCAQCDALRLRLEAAEKERDDVAQQLVQSERGKRAISEECDALRAKIEQMEKQEPVGVLHVGSYYGEELQDWEFEANQCACDKLNEVYVSNPTSLPLYALPGAKGEEK